MFLSKFCTRCSVLSSARHNRQGWNWVKNSLLAWWLGHFRPCYNIIWLSTFQSWQNFRILTSYNNSATRQTILSLVLIINIFLSSDNNDTYLVQNIKEIFINILTPDINSIVVRETGRDEVWFVHSSVRIIIYTDF